MCIIDMQSDKNGKLNERYENVQSFSMRYCDMYKNKTTLTIYTQKTHEQSLSSVCKVMCCVASFILPSCHSICHMWELVAVHTFMCCCRFFFYFLNSDFITGVHTRARTDPEFKNITHRCIQSKEISFCRWHIKKKTKRIAWTRSSIEWTCRF